VLTTALATGAARVAAKEVAVKVTTAASQGEVIPSIARSDCTRAHAVPVESIPRVRHQICLHHRLGCALSCAPRAHDFPRAGPPQ